MGIPEALCMGSPSPPPTLVRGSDHHSFPYSRSANFKDKNLSFDTDVSFLCRVRWSTHPQPQDSPQFPRSFPAVSTQFSTIFPKACDTKPPPWGAVGTRPVPSRASLPAAGRPEAQAAGQEGAAGAVEGVRNPAALRAALPAGERVSARHPPRRSLWGSEQPPWSPWRPWSLSKPIVGAFLDQTFFSGPQHPHGHCDTGVGHFRSTVQGIE